MILNQYLRTRFVLVTFLILSVTNTPPGSAADLMATDNAAVKVGIDREMGGAITWLSSNSYPKNIVNLADPGRLIQQSYYAGKSLDRTDEGQSKSWSPWPWNPIQGGGVGASGSRGSWARVTVFEKRDETLYSETVPKLWDMADEEADAVMRQWTTIDPKSQHIIHVRCEFQSNRKKGDRWGDAVSRHQEVPACYFTRSFSRVKSYLGEGNWRDEQTPPGPPWGRTTPPLDAMAFFNAAGDGVAVYSPEASEHWNFGPHGGGQSDDPVAGPCMHVAPIVRATLDYDTVLKYQYWLIVGNETEIVAALDSLLEQHASPTTD